MSRLQIAITSLISLLFFLHLCTATRISSYMAQQSFEVNAELYQWQISLSNDWDALGPFPIHAREQHFLSPGFPLNLTSPYHHERNRTWPSSLSESADVGWKRVQSGPKGDLVMSFPDIRWSKIRATEGWAGLQHHTVLHTSLIVQPPRLGNRGTQQPRVRVQLTQGSFFAILPREPAGLHPEWHPGNIYAMNRAPPNSVELPGIIDTDKPTAFDFFVSGDYEIRLFGDPRDSGEETPTLRINVAVNAEEKCETVVRQDSHDVICDFVGGIAFGDALGVGLRSIDGWWSVKDIELPEHFPRSISLTLFHRQVIAPSQARIVPILIKQSGIYTGKEISFSIILTEHLAHDCNSEAKTVSVPITLSVQYLSQWNSSNWEAIRGTFFFASSHPTYFLAKPPIAPKPGSDAVPVLALHGAGVDIISAPFWAEAIPRQKYSWIVMSVGRTEWGLDWHGPSASEAWATLPALSVILKRNTDWGPWSFSSDSRALILGHSNGGQGAWYLASRYPDRAHALLAAAGFLSAAAYVPLTQSRGARFADPALRAVLESSFVPDDNALFLGNLADSIPVLAVHGGDDTNVPTWHSREYVSIVKSWGKGLNVSFHVDENQSHWYQTVFESEQVRSFLTNALDPEDARPSSSDDVSEFTLTVVDPAHSGSLNGFRIDGVQNPGRLARLHVQLREDGVHVKTINVRMFSRGPASHWSREPIIVDGTHLPGGPPGNRERVSFTSEAGIWHETTEVTTSLSEPPGRLQNIFDTQGPLTIVIPSDSNIHASMLSTALRISQALDVYLKLDSEIVFDTDVVHILEASEEQSENALQRWQGSVIILGGRENTLSRKLLQVPDSERQTEFGISESGEWLFRSRPLREGNDDLGILFTHPHPTNPSASAVFLSVTSSEGLERVLRLFVPRTGIAVPDWMIVGEEEDQLGAGGVIGAGVWDSSWKWSEAMSYMS